MNPYCLFFLLGVAFILNPFVAQASEIKVDNLGRLIDYPGKIKVPCPKQTDKTAVVFVIGQSNSANHAEKKYSTKYPTQVFNYFNGQCFVATSPLLGATGTNGEFITLLADNLIDNGDYESVVIVSSGIGGTPIQRWQKNGDLNAMMQSVLAELNTKFKITEIIWHQGEADFAEKTPTEKYTASFYSLLTSIRPPGTTFPPIFYAVATKCGGNPEWTINNPTAKAQRSLANEGARIYLGADTDRLLVDDDRLGDKCHFSAQGQLKTAGFFAEAIHRTRHISK